MFTVNPILNADFYKQSHYRQYSPNTEVVYSTWTPRKSRLDGVNKVVFFGLQYFIKDYLIESFNNDFFNKPKDEVIGEFKRVMKNTIGTDDAAHWEALHDLGYLPLKICALPEGTLTPIRCPMFTIENTLPEFYWLTNFIETVLSTEIWKPMTSATIALQYRKILDEYANKTCDNNSHVDFQGHDFSYRGMAGTDSGSSSGAGHLLSFKGTDTIPAILWLETYYKTDVKKELVGASIPATEHSVAETNIIEIQDKIEADGLKQTLRDEFDLGGDYLYGILKDSDTRLVAEICYFNRLLETYSGIFSYVADTYNLWEVCSTILPILKERIMRRDGKVVIRPDSGDPVDIICGLNTNDNYIYIDDELNHVEGWTREQIDGDNYQTVAQCTKVEDYPDQKAKGVIELLWDVFGGTINSKGYKVLDPHVGCIYGDAITLDRAKEICRRLESKGFASSNIVLGIGSYTYNMNTRDTFGFALKTTYGVVNGKELMLYKDPITDDGTKKSQKGMVTVFRDEYFDQIEYKDCQTKKDKIGLEKQSVNQNYDEHYEMLVPVFENGVLLRDWSLEQVRNRLKQEVITEFPKEPVAV